MDLDPPASLDFIFYKGTGVKVLTCSRMGERHEPSDSTIYGSDHFPLVANFEFASFDS